MEIFESDLQAVHRDILKNNEIGDCRKKKQIQLALQLQFANKRSRAPRHTGVTPSTTSTLAGKRVDPVHNDKKNSRNRKCTVSAADAPPFTIGRDQKNG
jgi:hypothetical protein